VRGGLDHAPGVRFGRKAALTNDQKVTIRRLMEEEGYSIAQLQERFSVGRTTIYRALGKA
jgi:transposase